jgi:hypothetical protein
MPYDTPDRRDCLQMGDAGTLQPAPLAGPGAVHCVAACDWAGHAARALAHAEEVRSHRGGPAQGLSRSAAAGGIPADAARAVAGRADPRFRPLGRAPFAGTGGSRQARCAFAKGENHSTGVLYPARPAHQSGFREDGRDQRPVDHGAHRNPRAAYRRQGHGHLRYGHRGRQMRAGAARRGRQRK